jgi:NTE family protein
MKQSSKPRIGLALGSGSARGMAHIGIIQQLERLGIKPDIVCGTSAGALIGATYVSGHLQDFADWALQLKPADIIHYMNIRLSTNGGGLADASRLINHFRKHYGDLQIENLSIPYAAVATNLNTGQEIWLQKGDLWDSVRASIALPGLLSPKSLENHYLVDGGLVNPVPVSLCRALGADIIIAVNLNGDLIGRHFDEPRPRNKPENKPATPPPLLATPAAEGDDNFFARLSNNLWDRTAPLISEWFDSHDDSPSLANVIASAINIMQDRITRSRLAGEPADVVLSPRLSHIGLMEFNRADEAIEEGRRCVDYMQPHLKFALRIQ